MCQRLNTGESNNFYFGIFICIGPLRILILSGADPGFWKGDREWQTRSRVKGRNENVS